MTPPEIAALPLSPEARATFEKIGKKWQRDRFAKRAEFLLQRASCPDLASTVHTLREERRLFIDIREKARALGKSMRNAERAGAHIEFYWNMLMCPDDNASLATEEIPEWFPEWLRDMPMAAQFWWLDEEDRALVRLRHGFRANQSRISKPEHITKYSLKDLFQGIAYLQAATTWCIMEADQRRRRGGQKLEGSAAYAAHCIVIAWFREFGKWPATEKGTIFAKFIAAAFPPYGLLPTPGPGALARIVEQGKALRLESK